MTPMRPMTAPSTPMVGANAAHELQCREVRFVAVFHGFAFDLHDFAQELGVGAIDHELHALARELVVDLVDVGFEGEETFAASLVGHVDEEVDGGGGVVCFAAHDRFEDELGQPDHDGERLGSHDGAEGADEQTIMRPGMLKRASGISAFDDVAADDADEREGEADDCREVH